MMIKRGQVILEPFGGKRLKLRRNLRRTLETTLRTISSKKGRMRMMETSMPMNF
jgi:hypothetical protein